MNLNSGKRKHIGPLKYNNYFEAISALFDQGLVSGGNFLLIVFSYKYLPIEQLGLLGYIISIYIGATLFNTAVLFQDLSVEYPKYPNKKLLFGAAFNAQVILSLILAVALTLLYMTIEEEVYKSSQFEILLLILLFLVVQQLADFARRSSYIFFSAKLAMVVSLLIYPLRIGLILFLHPNSLSYLLEILVLSGLTAVLILLYQFAKLTNCNSINALEYNYLEHFNRIKWLVLTIPLTWLWGYLPVFMLGKLIDLKSVGVFLALRNITNVGNIFMEAMDTKLAAFLGRVHHANVILFMRNIGYTKVAGVIGWGLLFIVFLMFGHFILAKIYDERFSIYSSQLILLWIVHFFVFGIRLRSIQIRTEGKTRKIIFLSYLTGALITLLAGYILIGRYEIIGAVFTLIIASAAIYFSMMIFQKKVR